MSLDKLTAAIQKAGTSKRTKEFEWSFLPGFYCTLTYMSKHMVGQLRESAQLVDTNPRNQQKEFDLSPEKVTGFYATRVVKGWRNFKVRHLKVLFPALKIDTLDDLKELELLAADAVLPDGVEVADVEVAFSQKIVRFLLDYSVEFENWVVNVVRDIRNFKEAAEQAEEDLENLA